MSGPALAPTWPAVPVSGFFPRGTAAGTSIELLPPTSAEVKNEWSHTSAPPLCLHADNSVDFTVHCLGYIFVIIEWRRRYWSIQLQGEWWIGKIWNVAVGPNRGATCNLPGETDENTGCFRQNGRCLCRTKQLTNTILEHYCLASRFFMWR